MPFVVNNTSFPGLLDLIAPHSCRGCGRIGTPFCDHCKKYIIANQKHLDFDSRNNFPDLPPVYVVGKREGALATAIHDYKYHSTRALALELAKLLDSTLPPTLINFTIVPLPTATHHIRNRGFDHTLLLAKKLAHLRGATITPLLQREKNTVQVGTDEKTRLAQALVAYAINPRFKINPNITYLLLDDVWTTGATMHTVVEKLQQAGVSNIKIALLAYST